jgi:hypothetical protein
LANGLDMSMGRICSSDVPVLFHADTPSAAVTIQ